MKDAGWFGVPWSSTDSLEIRVSIRRKNSGAMEFQGVAFEDSVFGAAGRSIAINSETVTNL